MYVCICNGYREKELRDIAQEGVACAREAYNALGHGPCCGRCLEFAQDIIDQEHEASLVVMAAAS